ncbi:nuclear transport factor 2 family protein [Phenylobacterium sp.]|uniref:nuclear transport factor 2 family protein n=1 Tax=Phenylobacterium sp. TaxID=1871053 RepID=UPI002F924ED5
MLIGLVAAGVAGPAAGQDRAGKVQAELRALMDDLNAAIARRDRKALEEIYAPEFVWVHAPGYVEDRATQLRNLTRRDRAPAPLPPLSFEPPASLVVSGDTAILRTVLQRDGRPGAWGSTVYVRRGGRWRILQMQSTPLPPPRATAALNQVQLGRFAGAYAQENGVTTELRIEAGALHMKAPRFPARPLTPTGASTFVDPLGNEIAFEVDAAGHVTGYRMRFRDGRTTQGRRTSPP